MIMSSCKHHYEFWTQHPKMSGTKVVRITTVDSLVIGGVSQQEPSIPAPKLEDTESAKQNIIIWKFSYSIQ